MRTTKSQTLTYPATVKAVGHATNDRRLSFIISTGDVDRDNDTILPGGWQLHDYQKNPIVLWQHDRSRPPIARTVDIGVIGKTLHAVAEFPPVGLYSLSDEIYGLAKAGFISSASVGFLPGMKSYNSTRGGWDIKDATLLEWSVVNVPANSQAVIQRCLGLGCDDQKMTQWLKGLSCGCADDQVLLIEDEDIFLEDIPAPAPVKGYPGCPRGRHCPTGAHSHPDHCIISGCPLRVGGKKHEDVLVLDDEAEHIWLSPRTVTQLVTVSVEDYVRDAVRQEINYHRGKVA